MGCRFVIGIAVLVVLAAGCRQTPLKGGGPDSGYLSEPKPSVREKGGPNLFPSALGNQWTMQVNTGGKKAVEQITVARQRHIEGGVRVLWKRQGGGRSSLEVYAADKQGVSQLAFGPRANIVLVPPLPILRYPATEGAMYVWEGKLRSGRSVTPGEAGVRVTRIETVATPAGKFKAFRVDTVMTLLRNGLSARLPSTSWYAPGVGIVQQEYREGGGDRLVVKKLQSFRLK